MRVMPGFASQYLSHAIQGGRFLLEPNLGPEGMRAGELDRLTDSYLPHYMPLIMAATASPINAKPLCCWQLIWPIQNNAKN